jgi:type I restriction-modification system DNA methylase subunit
MPSEGKTAVPRLILDLVDRFERNHQAYKSGSYNEAQVRIEFLDPFFKALGWDIGNELSYAEAYKDVVHEDAIKMGDGTRAPDYSFRIGGTRKFFLEAKRPSIDIKNDASPAFQLRRYAWTTKLPLSILTDFEEFAVYDCRVKPDQKDKASVARIQYIHFTEYATRWDEIASVFSRDAVLKGSFDKYAEENKAKRGTAAVDDAFLQTIESWRKALAENLALRNKKLTQRETNFAVQRIIDRIIFLRICEGRGIEDYGKLRALADQDGIYPRLGQLFKEADDRYNSGLFHFKPEKGRHEPPDQLTLSLDLDDKLLRGILKSLYYPESPYVFSALPADVLGQVYEQFLGKVIRLTEGHHAKVEDKPEVKKAGGVYYTPTYIVDYIVENTVGKLLEGKTLKQAAALRILDPACGSGSFLLGAYEYLLQWHLKLYTETDPAKWARGSKPALVQASGGGWKLTIAERKRILLANIYGVDIDAQAVETTKLSLLLKVLEGETQQTLQPVLLTFQERALPDLGDNIKCGNSLIGPDFHQQQLLPLDEEDRYRINMFDWNKEFSDIFKSGGFDGVIGNPPYIRMEEFKELKAYLRSHYSSHGERSDLYAYFIERSHQLLRKDGRFGMIVSNKFLRANYGKPLRDFLTRSASIERVTDFAGLPVFIGATVRTIVILTRKGVEQSRMIKYSPPPGWDDFRALVDKSKTVIEASEAVEYDVTASSLKRDIWAFGEVQQDELLERIRSTSTPLKNYCNGLICRGVVSGCTEAFIIDEKTRSALVKTNREAREILKPVLNGRDIRRYLITPTNSYLIYTYHGINMRPFSAVLDYLHEFKPQLESRATTQEWYELQQPQLNFSKFMDGPKIIFPDMAISPRFALDETGFYSTNTTYFIPKADSFLLGLLNSSLGRFYFVTACAGLEGKNETYLRFFGQYLEGFPVKSIDLSNRADRSRHDQVVKLVDQTLDLHKKLPIAKTPQEKTSLERQIAATDAQIDRLVYDLYSLTPKEIKIVEASTPAK